MNTLLKQEYIHTYIYVTLSRMRAICICGEAGATEVTVCNGIGMGDDNVDDPDAIVLRKRRTAITRERELFALVSGDQVSRVCTRVLLEESRNRVAAS